MLFDLKQNIKQSKIASIFNWEIGMYSRKKKKFCISLEGELPVKKDFKLDNIRPWEYKLVFAI